MSLKERELVEKLRRIASNLRTLRKELEPVLLDEMSEARAYRDMALACKDPETKWKLVIVAIDSILHRELVWSLYRASLSIEMFLRDLEAAPPIYEELSTLLEKIKIHREIEELARANYEDLKRFTEPGTTMYRLIELLEKEEEKHHLIVRNIIRSIGEEKSGEESK